MYTILRKASGDWEPSQEAGEECTRRGQECGSPGIRKHILQLLRGGINDNYTASCRIMFGYNTDEML